VIRLLVIAVVLFLATIGACYLFLLWARSVQ